MSDSILYKKKNQNELIMKYIPLVKKIVGKINSKNREYEEEDMVNIGVIGLMDALSNYNPKKNVPFEAYASIRIRGAIIDDMRKTGPVSRNKIEKLNNYYKAKEELENKLKRTPLESEICESLEIDSKELSKLHETVHYISGVSLESVLFRADSDGRNFLDVLEDKHISTPEEKIIEKENRESLITAIEKLKKRERIILNLYYVENLTLKEISHILDISIPRVSQIHGKIILKLRNLMEES